MERAAKPVDVICVCNADGEIRPLRLRLENDAQGDIRIEIGEIFRVERNLRFGAESITFLCRGSAGGRSHLLEIRYAVRSHRWSVLRSSDN